MTGRRKATILRGKRKGKKVKGKEKDVKESVALSIPSFYGHIASSDSDQSDGETVPLIHVGPDDSITIEVGHFSDKCDDDNSIIIGESSTSRQSDES